MRGLCLISLSIAKFGEHAGQVWVSFANYSGRPSVAGGSHYTESFEGYLTEAQLFKAVKPFLTENPGNEPGDCS